MKKNVMILTREYLKSSLHSQRESGLESCQIPKHIAIIMDGNRRYRKNEVCMEPLCEWYDI